MPLPISVFIIAQNESDRIAPVITSVIDWVDEVIVIDGGSSDDTVTISKKLGATVIHNDWPGYGPQKVFGESNCKNDWILNIDADEEVSPELQTEIKTLFKSKPPLNAYRLKIVVTGRFHDKPPRFAPSNEPIRLYNKHHAGFSDSIIHDSVLLKDPKEKVQMLASPVIHRTFRSYQHAAEKLNNYSSLQAEDMFKKGRNPSRLRIAFEPWAAFVKFYFFRRNCLYGVEGFAHSVLYMYFRTIRLAKARELFEIEKRNIRK